MNEQEELQKTITTGARFIGAIVGCVFAGVGLTVLGFLWSQPFGGFHSPPLFFRIFGSFVAIPFVAIGSFTAYKAITSKGILPKSNVMETTSTNTKRGTYTCPKCNAPLSDNIEVSPHGDVKCGYCNSWFNIHHA
ncbi:hypothetical protein [Gimesia aquarii]|uniref:Uncharacterized protein n=1 Tax=Gimesia aquarii TaxID=2527964 RepID=A0A517WRQ3_9PLAN|nr:hypothetical protein [Gimesia aquarii]QDU07929.1 hypothetical protein V202x_12900 [Gimesia aquarii]